MEMPLSPLSKAASLTDYRAAELLLAGCRSPAVVRAVARRADELRLIDPDQAWRVSGAAVAVLVPMAAEPSLQALVWAIHGSALRGITRLEAAEVALTLAVDKVPADDHRTRAEVLRRLATLRAEQRRPQEAKALLPVFLAWARRLGGLRYGEDLLAAGAILIVISDPKAAVPLLEEALSYLPANGDRLHVSAVYNLCRCHLDLSTEPATLNRAVELAREAERLIEPGDYTGLKMQWLTGQLHHRLGDFDAALGAFTAVLPGIEAANKPFDQALLLVDLAEIHLERGSVALARKTALSGFPLLHQLRAMPEAFKAFRLLQRASETPGRDLKALLSIVRQQLLAAL